MNVCDISKTFFDHVLIDLENVKVRALPSLDLFL